MKIPKLTLCLTSLVTLLPIIAGLLLWNQLPDLIPTHFGLNNEPNGWSSKPFAVFGIPLFLLALQGVCLFAFRTDPKKRNMNGRVLGLVLWIIPACSLLVAAMCYPTALGKAVNVGFVVNLFLGVLFVAIGNFLPKCQQTYTMGIRTPWALNDKGNWAYTHRVSGWIWSVGGLLMLLFALLDKLWVNIGILAVMVLSSFLVSYLYYRRHGRED